MKKLSNHFFDNDFIKAFLELTIGLIGGTLLVLTLTGCEKEYNAYPNHIYTFSYLANEDEWGVKTWGSHHFVTNEEIQDIEAFKECYVKYLCWNGLDKDCIVKKIYYTDRKKIKIQYLGKSPAVRTVIDINNCQ